ncbi:MAG TPA: VOC family protein [Bosea sp. (in: a-proteobacteria)]|jgi:catechol 2,3-dioxygenase|uniref:VOC family protein n=1 Tax=Bosea sp. (in: a-proteobacteria) TaxID=1871050 RepID=UPI002E121D02|nr:VOC family protein [Bosea sp. (in: a-proteobacteria)]
MTIALTRRTLLHLAGASSLTAAMTGAAQAEGGPVAAPPAGPGFANKTPLRIGQAALRVRDIERVSAFYRDVLGLSVLARGEGAVTLGTADGALLTLASRPGAALEPPTQAGLFHTAFLMPTRKDLARWLVHVARNQTPLTGFADHSVSEAVYLNDPEGNGIEVYADRPAERWRWEAGRVVMGTHRLDVDDILTLTDTQATNYARAPDGLRIGHVHLRVGDVAAGDKFYKDLLGLSATSRRDTASFLSSGGYHHHLAMNTWNSAGAGRRDDSSTGLAWFSLMTEKPELMTAKAERFAAAGVATAPVAGGFESADPWGTRVRLLQG